MHGLSHAGLKECILRDRKGKTKEDKHLLGDDLWPTVAMAVGGGRPVLSVYNHVKRQHDPHVKAGPWSMAEDAALEAAVKEHGTQWGKVGADVARNPTDCRDRYTKQLKPAVTGKRKRGKWEHAEEEKLRGLVKVHGNAWKTIEKLMDGRTATQCRTKWCVSSRISSASRADLRPLPQVRFARSQPRHQDSIRRRRGETGTRSSLDHGGSFHSRSCVSLLVRFGCPPSSALTRLCPPSQCRRSQGQGPQRDRLGGSRRRQPRTTWIHEPSQPLEAAEDQGGEGSRRRGGQPRGYPCS